MSDASRLNLTRDTTVSMHDDSADEQQQEGVIQVDILPQVRHESSKWMKNWEI